MKRSKSNHFVYKYVYNGEIIYIGKTDGPLEDRLRQHGKNGDNIPSEYHEEINNSTIYYFRVANSIMSDVVESELIRRHNPRLNKAKKSEWDGMDFPEPKWKKYVPITDKCTNTNGQSVKRKRKDQNKGEVDLHTTQRNAMIDSVRSLGRCKEKLQFLIDVSDTEEMKLLVRDFLEIRLYTVTYDVPKYGYRSIKPPMRMVHYPETDEYFLTYSVSRLREWISNDLVEFESELNRIGESLSLWDGCNGVLFMERILGLNAAMQELNYAKILYQNLADSANAEKMKLPVKDESQMKLYMRGIHFKIPKIVSGGLCPPIKGIHETDTDRYYITYSVSKLKKWISDDLYGHEVMFNKIAEELESKLH